MKTISGTPNVTRGECSHLKRQTDIAVEPFARWKVDRAKIPYNLAICQRELERRYERGQ